MPLEDLVDARLGIALAGREARCEPLQDDLSLLVARRQLLEPFAGEEALQDALLPGITGDVIPKRGALVRHLELFGQSTQTLHVEPVAMGVALRARLH